MDITPRQARRNARMSCADGAANSLMVGFGETYLAAFALSIGMSQVTAGFLVSLPMITGGLLQLLGPRGARAFGSYKRWVLLCVGFQAMAHIPLAWAAWVGTIPPVVLFAIAAIYWGFGMAGGPTWNNWIEAIIPRTELRDFLAVRSRLTQLAAFLAFLSGGLWLHFAAERNMEATGYVVLFAVAGLSRFASVAFLAGQSDVVPPPENISRLPLRQALRRFRDPAGGRFLLFILTMQIAVQIGAPFFSPYMLAHLKLSYADFAVLISASYVAKILAYPYVSRFVRHVGAYKALMIGGLLVALPPPFWVWTPQLPALVALQFFAGASWAIFELASALLIFERIPAKERVGMLTYQNLLNASAVVIGSLIGGALLQYGPQSTSYLMIFLGTGFGRLLSLVVLVGVGPLVREVRGLVRRVSGLKPLAGAAAASPLMPVDQARVLPHRPCEVGEEAQAARAEG